MVDDRLQQRAAQLAARVEALAKALRACGVPEENSVELLSRASAAVLQALNLEVLLDEPRKRHTYPRSETALRAASKKGPAARLQPHFRREGSNVQPKSGKGPEAKTAAPAAA